MRRLLSISLVVLAAAACTDEYTSPVEPEVAESGKADFKLGEEATYRVTISNLTSGQPFTPPLAAVHRRSVDLFKPGRRASEGIQQIAENGNLDPMLMALAERPGVKQVVVTQGPTIPPLLPGESVSFEVKADQQARYLSLVSMLICTNDGFMGANGWLLPHKVGRKVKRYAKGFDAGTEINTEDFADLVPPCAPLTGVMTTDMGTGTSNPELAEGRRVRPHRGIRGIDDLVPDIHDWNGPVAQVEIERIG